MKQTAAAPLWKDVVKSFGLVFGDIGTSPIYTLSVIFALTKPTYDNVMGILSLVFWTMTILVSAEYSWLAMKLSRKGEGGTIVLKEILVRLLKPGRKVAFVAFLSYLGVSLLLGDGVITPAISILSAVEGLELIPGLEQMPQAVLISIAAAIAVVLFVFQYKGTDRVASLFGPVMVIWFAALTLSGLASLLQRPELINALNPVYALKFFQDNGFSSFFVLSEVILCATGGEALYADMGHLGRKPIVIAWYFAFCALAINYLGQGAFVLSHGGGKNILFSMIQHQAPVLYVPFLLLAVMATIIASQAMISGVYSLTQQAIQLGFIPRMRIIHTSEQASGQIYMPTVNWMLMIACLTLVLVFKESTRLAAAYGIAVTATMAITSFMYFLVIRIKWNWPLWQSVALLGLFLFFDGSFLSANLLKIVDGGWITICIASLILITMITWRDGRALLAKYYQLMRMPAEVFLKDLAEYSPHRTSGTAVFMSITPEGIPHTLLHHLKHNDALHERVLLLSILSAETPTVPPVDRVSLEDLGHGFYRVKANYGFMETPNMPRILNQVSKKGVAIDIHTTSFFLGRETLFATGHGLMARWRKKLFIFMARNAWNATSFFKLPPDRVVELGNQVEL